MIIIVMIVTTIISIILLLHWYLLLLLVRYYCFIIIPVGVIYGNRLANSIENQDACSYFFWLFMIRVV